MDIHVAGPLASSPRWVLRAEPPRTDQELLAAELRDVLSSIDHSGGGSVQLWIPAVTPDDDRTATALGFIGYRDLWQLRTSLPTDPTDLPVRMFDPDRDLEDFLEVNARAFAWHPEQGRLTAEDLRATMAERWFDPAGFLLHHRDGKLAGFCWTKVHRDVEPALGEIYAIAVDPAFHGQGLGDSMTRAGLDHLAAEGLSIAMLYVESDNHAANRTYTRIGFSRHHTDRAYRIDR
ncbi:MAG: mycothiol synthase [Acidimicrobiia bacterium]|nr:mycothiol synthase [Acidimicrobiia bacterium]